MKKLLAAVLVAGMAFIACQKEYSIESGTNTNLTGAWEFKDSANTVYAGNPIQYYIDDTTDPTSAHMVYSGATTSLNAQFSIEVFFPTDSAKTGTYSSALGQVNFLYQTNTGKYFKVDAFAGQFSTENITVVLTKVNDSTVTGTFSGTALDSASRLIAIKEGKFSYRRAATTAPTPTASAGTLGTATDTCTGAVVNGTYKKATAVTGTNTVTVTANVTTIGTYTIYTDTLKGIFFAGTGSFTTTGVQSVTIPAVGTPTDSGTVRFRIRYGTSSCTFKVKIDTSSGTVVIPPTGDYFPLTTNSNWSYDSYDSGITTPSDTIYTRSTGVLNTFSGNPFNQFLNFHTFSIDTGFYRKNSGLYYASFDLNSLFGSGGTAITTFLKDNVPVNSTWSDTYPINYNGISATIKVDYVILAKAVSATVGPITSADVIKVRAKISLGILGAYTPYSTEETWFGRGIGIMYVKDVNLTGGTPYLETKIRRAQIVP